MHFLSSPEQDKRFRLLKNPEVKGNRRLMSTDEIRCLSKFVKHFSISSLSTFT